MAISGNLKDISFVELLRLVGKRTGRLCVFDFNNKRQYEWYLYQSELCAVRINQISLYDEAEIYQTALTLALDSTSSYIFYKQETISEKFPFEIEIALDMLMTKALSNISVSSSDYYAQHFPHQETKFEAISNHGVTLFDDSLKFWRQSAGLLRLGASAAEIAYQTQTDVELARVELYKLKLLGVVRPIRVFAQTIQMSPLSARQILQPLDLVTESSATTESETIASSAASEIKDSWQNLERKSLVSRMLGSLFGKQKFI